MSTINLEEIKTFSQMKNNAVTSPKESCTPYNIYKMRWSIEVMFYQQKSFWSFGEYMVRSQEAIQKYVNLIGVTYTLAVVLPFINEDLSEYQFLSPQEIKCNIATRLTTELIYSNLLKTLQIKQNTTDTEKILEYLLQLDLVS